MQGPANDVWVVRSERYGEILLPVTEEVVSAIPATGSITVTLLEGLL